MSPKTNNGTQAAETPMTDRGLKTKSELSFGLGIDWVTCTTPSDETGVALYSVANKYWSAYPDDVRDWNNQWYTGRSGAGVSWGFGKQGYLFMASGQAAPDVWKQAVITKARVTRLDLQVTARLPQPHPNLPKHAYTGIVAAGLQEQRQYGLIQNTKGGVTLYAGSRNSAMYGRFYDKGVESETASPGLLYRYEVELKKPKSGSLAEYLLTQLEDGIYPEKELIWYVYNWWIDRGVQPVFNPKKAPAIELSSITVQNDLDKKLTWLRGQVAPTIAKLTACGRLNEALDALGITKA